MSLSIRLFALHDNRCIFRTTTLTRCTVRLDSGPCLNENDCARLMTTTYACLGQKHDVSFASYRIKSHSTHKNLKEDTHRPTTRKQFVSLNDEFRSNIVHYVGLQVPRTSVCATMRCTGWEEPAGIPELHAVWIQSSIWWKSFGLHGR